MALWKITIPKTGNTNGVHFEKGMSVEYATKSINKPTGDAHKCKDIEALFMSKYGIDIKRACLTRGLDCEIID